MDDFKVKRINPFENTQEIKYTENNDNQDKVNSQQTPAADIENGYKPSKADSDFNSSNKTREEAITAKADAEIALKEAKSPEEVEKAQKTIEEANKVIEKTSIEMNNANSNGTIIQVDGWN